jgi:NAD(P)-dependent dehydrogenase (short-subunit alcohol dehydrogenase family)
MSKTILIAGASSAIAQASIIQLLQKGHHVVAISRQSLAIPGVDCHQVEGYQPEQLPNIVQELDGIVYFPGAINLKPFNRLSLTDFKNEMDIHAWGAVSILQKYISLIPKTQMGSVVLLGSVAAQLGMPYHASVSMAKGAIHGLTLALAAEWAPRIRVNAVAPSLTDTPMGEKLINTPEKREFIEKKNPMGKIGHAEDIASAITFLLSDESNWMTGQVLSVYGGMGKIKL